MTLISALVAPGGKARLILSYKDEDYSVTWEKDKVGSVNTTGQNGKFEQLPEKVWSGFKKVRDGLMDILSEEDK